MLTAGSYHTLTVNRISDYGLFLIDADQQEVLLPNRYVSLDNKVGDQLSVFVYHDSEDRIVASTETPYATVGEITALKVVDKTIHGAFLDWGLSAKDIFLPNRNMLGGVEIGKKSVVYIYRDNITGRAVATMALKGFVSNTELTIKLKQEVDMIIAQEVPLGYRVVINNMHWGMLYRNQIFSHIEIGDTMKGYVRKITEDNRIDVSLQMEGYDEVKKSADKLLELMKNNEGMLALTDASAPEKVYDATQMSKKVFKRSVGYLLKNGHVEMNESGIKIIKK